MHFDQYGKIDCLPQKVLEKVETQRSSTKEGETRMNRVTKKKQGKSKTPRVIEKYNELLLRQEKFAKRLNDQAWKMEKKRHGGSEYVV